MTTVLPKKSNLIFPSHILKYLFLYTHRKLYKELLCNQKPFVTLFINCFAMQSLFLLFWTGLTQRLNSNKI